MEKLPIEKNIIWSIERPKNYNILKLKSKIFKNLKKILEIQEFHEKEYLELLKEETKEKTEEEHFQNCTHELWKINNNLEIPLKYKYLESETKKVIEIIRKLELKIFTWINSFLVPWSLSSLRKILEYGIIKAKDIEVSDWDIKVVWVKYGIIKAKDIEITIKDGTNIQEWTRFVKESVNENPYTITHFDKETDKITKINITLWDNSSVAHWVSFKVKELEEKNKFKYNLKIGENIFLWIISQIWSEVEIGNNSSIWCGANIEESDIKEDSHIWNWLYINNTLNIFSNKDKHHGNKPLTVENTSN